MNLKDFKIQELTTTQAYIAALILIIAVLSLSIWSSVDGANKVITNYNLLVEEHNEFIKRCPFTDPQDDKDKPLIFLPLEDVQRPSPPPI